MQRRSCVLAGICYASHTLSFALWKYVLRRAYRRYRCHAKQALRRARDCYLRSTARTRLPLGEGSSSASEKTCSIYATLFEAGNALDSTHLPAVVPPAILVSDCRICKCDVIDRYPEHYEQKAPPRRRGTPSRHPFTKRKDSNYDTGDSVTTRLR